MKKQLCLILALFLIIFSTNKVNAQIINTNSKKNTINSNTSIEQVLPTISTK